jgi:hypothetical protein
MAWSGASTAGGGWFTRLSRVRIVGLRSVLNCWLRRQLLWASTSIFLLIRIHELAARWTIFCMSSEDAFHASTHGKALLAWYSGCYLLCTTSCMHAHGLVLTCTGIYMFCQKLTLWFKTFDTCANSENICGFHMLNPRDIGNFSLGTPSLEKNISDACKFKCI